MMQGYDDYLVVETKPKLSYDPIKPFVVSAKEDGKKYYFLANNTFATAGASIIKTEIWLKR